MADNEVNSFLKDLQGPEESILDKPLNITETTDEEPEKETPVRKVELDEDGYPKNRQGRRKRAEDERLRDEIRQLNERVKVLSEADRFKEDIGDDYKKLLEPIFGTADENGKYDPKRELATKNLIAAFEKMKESAKKEWLAEIQSRDLEGSREQQQADTEVDDMLDHVEEDYGLDMSNDNVRNGFLTLMEKMSPKYEDGNIKEFADYESVAEAYIELQKRGGSSRAKEVAARSMTRSGESQPSRLPQNAIDRYMEEHGLDTLFR